jgi:ribosome-binding protein aMBF1 (putative translation factor)
MYGIEGPLEVWLEKRSDPSVREATARVAKTGGSVGERLRLLREFSGLRQRDVVWKLGLPQDRICHIERGRRIPTDQEFAQLAELFVVDQEKLRSEPNHP